MRISLSVCLSMSCHATPPKPLNGFWWNFTYSNIIPFLHFQREITEFLIKKRAGFHFVGVLTVPPIPNQSVNARWRGNALLIISTINIRHDLFSLFFTFWYMTTLNQCMYCKERIEGQIALGSLLQFVFHKNEFKMKNNCQKEYRSYHNKFKPDTL